MADTPRTAAPQSSGLNRLLMWPAMTLAFVLIPWMATMVVADSTGMSFNEAADLVAAWSLIEDAGPNVEMTVGFSFLGVIATIVIGLAFSLPADGVWGLPKKTRDLVEFLTLGVTLTLSLFSAMVLWVVFWRDTTFELVLLLLSAWLVSVVAGLVELKRPAAERVPAARREAERLREAIARSSFDEKATITAGQRVRAELAYWSIALVGLPLLGLLGLAVDSGGFTIDPLVLVLASGTGLIAVSWRVTASIPPHKISDRALTVTLHLTGLIIIAIVVLGAMGAGLGSFASLSALAAILANVIYATPAAAERIPFMKTIRHDATLRRIRRADAWHAAVQREFGEEEEAQPSPEAPRREPLIRIEIFRRRK